MLTEEVRLIGAIFFFVFGSPIIGFKAVVFFPQKKRLFHVLWGLFSLNLAR